MSRWRVTFVPPGRDRGTAQRRTEPRRDLDRPRSSASPGGRIDITTPRPQAEAVNESAPVHFKLPVAYRVDKDTAIPGTVATYLGKTDQGARLGHIQGYEYRQVGDSIAWQGKLKEGVWVDLVLRTALITDNSLDLIGTADVWILPSPGQAGLPLVGNPTSQAKPLD
jgi:hypothetical protein